MQCAWCWQTYRETLLITFYPKNFKNEKDIELPGNNYWFTLPLKIVTGIIMSSLKTIGQFEDALDDKN